MQRVLHSSHSPDLALCSYFPFMKLKLQLTEKKYKNCGLHLPSSMHKISVNASKKQAN
jgi:hypothetical protein